MRKITILSFELLEDDDFESQVKSHLSLLYQKQFDLLDHNEMQYTIHVQYMNVVERQTTHVVVQLEADDDAFILWQLSSEE